MATAPAQFISVVIPVKDEAESLPELAASLARVLPPLAPRHEIVFIDDGSTDGSLEVLQRLAETQPALRIFECRKNFGKATALDVGFRVARGDVVITMDADLQDDPDEIPRLLAKLQEGFDLVVGWKERRQDPWHKTLPSKLFNAVTSLVSRLKLHDFNCGLKAYRREVCENLSVYGELHRYLPALAYWKGFRVAEIPVNHRARRFGRSKFGAERYLRGFFDLLTVAFITKYVGRPMHFFGRVGLVLIVAGIAILGYLTAIKIGGAYIALRPLLWLGVLLLIIGMLFLSTGLLGEMIVYLHRSRDRRIPGHVVRSVHGAEK